MGYNVLRHYLDITVMRLMRVAHSAPFRFYGHRMRGIPDSSVMPNASLAGGLRSAAHFPTRRCCARAMPND